MRQLRPSTVRDHAACPAIDRALAHGEPLAAIGRRYGVSVSALSRRRNTLRQHHDVYFAAIATIRPSEISK